MLVTRQNFLVQSHNIDTNRYLSIQALAAYLQETAYQNVAELGMPYQQLMNRGLAWVLLKMEIRLLLPLREGETLTVSTYPAGSNRYFFFRDFHLYSGNQPIGQTSSHWALIDLASRKPCNVPEDLSPLTHCPVAEPLPKPGGKIHLPPLEQPVKFQARWLDIDVNQHVNNTVYFRWLVESLPVAFLQAHRLKHIRMSFRNECRIHEQVLAYASATDQEGTFSHLLVSETGKQLVHASSEWEKIPH